MPDEARPGERVRVSLTMIVREEETDLANYLAAVRRVFDKIMSGSTLFGRGLIDGTLVDEGERDRRGNRHSPGRSL
jgi:hypothetical protein